MRAMAADAWRDTAHTSFSWWTKYTLLFLLNALSVLEFDINVRETSKEINVDCNVALDEAMR